MLYQLSYAHHTLIGNSLTLFFLGCFCLHARKQCTAPLAPVSELKQIKPEGGDFVSAALGAAGVEQPAITKTMASLGASVVTTGVPRLMPLTAPQ
jgi:hypothetical protein